MRKNITGPLFNWGLAALFLMGCEGYKETMRGLGGNAGAIQARDVQCAASLRNELPRYLGLLSKSIRVEPGSGVVHVTISGVIDPRERGAIGSKLNDLQAKNPYMDAIKLMFGD